MQFTQEQTAIPNFLMGMGGDGVHNRTAEGATLQFNTASTPMKSVIFNFENYFIVKFVDKVAKLYLMFDKDPTIQGDVRVVAKGLQGVMEREALSNDLLQFAQIASSNPAWSEKTDVDAIFRMLVRSKGLTDRGVTYSDDYIAQKKMLEQQAQGEQQLALEQQQQQMQMKTRAETAPRDALIEAMKQAPDGSILKNQLIEEVLKTYGLLTPELQSAVEASIQMEHIKNQTEAHQLGSQLTGDMEEEGDEDVVPEMD
jgi:hypothetical protein